MPEEEAEHAGGAVRERGAAGECELRGEAQFPAGLFGIGAGSSAKLKEPLTKERKFEEVVKSAEQAACWYWCLTEVRSRQN